MDQTLKQAVPQSTWLVPGSAAFDFRGDVRTNPTVAMLNAIAHADLSDGVATSDPSTHELEDYVANLTARPAALFVLSGTMGNLVALRSLLRQPPYAILCDSRSHILASEAGGAFAFTGAIPQPIEPENGEYLTLEDILPQVVLPNDTTGTTTVHMCPTRVISLENTLRGMVMPLAEARRISNFAHENGILVHLDGARLWEAVATGSRSLAEYCSLFDTVSLCFSKGLGAPAGAIVIGSEPVIRHARWIRQSIGGSIRQPGPLSAAALVAVKMTFEAGLLKRSHEIAQDIAAYWQGCGGRLKHPTRSNMVWLDFTGLPFGLRELIDEGANRGVIISRDRLVVHYQICKEAVSILKQVMAGLTSRIL
ncbi:pyridoxal phosphate-dependent transferase [Aspergillus insuetus]